MPVSVSSQITVYPFNKKPLILNDFFTFIRVFNTNNKMKFLIALLLLFSIPVFSQTSPLNVTNQPLTKLSNGLINSQNVFIENIGQYGELCPAILVWVKLNMDLKVLVCLFFLRLKG